MQTAIAIVGCGFVADYYVDALKVHPQLRLMGSYDREEQNSVRFAGYHGIRRYKSLEELLSDRDVLIVVNLTSPASHFEISSAALRSCKHVYSEKPLTLDLEQAKELTFIAHQAKCILSGAPCCVLGESAQTLWRAIRNGAIGNPRLAYAEVDDGLHHRMPYSKWFSASGAPWPMREERELGCVRSHSGYPISWLAAMFGPVRLVTAFSGNVIDSATAGGNGHCGPDFGVASLSFDNNIVARLTCSTVAPRDRSLSVFGDVGKIATRDCSDDRSPVHIQKYFTIRRKMMTGWRRRAPLVRSGIPRVSPQGAQRRNFARGIAELADAIHEGRAPRLSADFCLHVTEVTLALHQSGSRAITSTFQPMLPMHWAKQ